VDFHPIFPSEPSKAGAPETANSATSVTNGAARGRGVKFTSEPAAALKLIDTEKWLGPNGGFFFWETKGTRPGKHTKSY